MVKIFNVQVTRWGGTPAGPLCSQLLREFIERGERLLLVIAHRVHIFERNIHVGSILRNMLHDVQQR